MRHVSLAIASLFLAAIGGACSNNSTSNSATNAANSNLEQATEQTSTQSGATYFEEPVLVLNQTSPQALGIERSRSPRSPGLTTPTDKKQRQAELDVRLDYPSELSRDPFATAPGLTRLPEVVIPDPIDIPVPPPPARPPQPSPSNRTAYTPPPQATAQVIEVSGVVEIGGRRYAIVTIPGDISSRYVTVGQRIASGQVLVKRIEMSTYPRVILQQNGREYAHSVKLGI
ncbi:hypothetical protein Pse7367_3163 [Thalassoporum mexicanum PCC 7367]|uniref:hypothetical protein n=1 Tax=Thalassoporum mexicanum TaxID=3457544 RepID=UPI00029FFBBD|nr:hypothetical protein [Pseudanabaena sp. PCC 7367]AFY71411.1 hypothetical protein Pse7367_3163 [Pseudanabaena sp. PCC 7367]